MASQVDASAGNDSTYGIRQLSQMRSASSREGDQAPCSVQSPDAPSTGNQAFWAIPPNPTTPIRNFFTLVSQVRQERIKALFQFRDFAFQRLNARMQIARRRLRRVI